MNNITLSDGEWKLMNELWENHPCSLAQLVNAFENDTGWSKSTIFVMLKRLIAKNAVKVDTSGRVQLYTPIIKKEETTVRETRSFLSRVYGGSIGLMVSSLAGQSSLSENEIAELRSILDEMEKKER